MSTKQVLSQSNVCAKCALTKTSSEMSKTVGAGGLYNCKQCQNKYAATQRDKHRQLHNQRAREHYKKNAKRLAAAAVERRKKARMDVLSHYSGGDIRCSCSGCPERAVEFMGIDHVDGSGGEHRRADKGATQLALWLIRNNFPDGFRVLCHNCNMSLGFYGYCPHDPSQTRAIRPPGRRPKYTQKTCGV